MLQTLILLFSLQVFANECPVLNEISQGCSKPNNPQEEFNCLSRQILALWSDRVFIEQEKKVPARCPHLQDQARAIEGACLPRPIVKDNKLTNLLCYQQGIELLNNNASAALIIDRLCSNAKYPGYKGCIPQAIHFIEGHDVRALGAAVLNSACNKAAEGFINYFTKIFWRDEFESCASENLAAFVEKQSNVQEKEITKDHPN